MDADLSDHSSLKGLRTDHPNLTVPALPVVVYLNVLEHLPEHGIPGLESFTMDRLHLETEEEALGTGIVVAAALGTSAAPELVPSQQRLVRRRAILACHGHHARPLPWASYGATGPSSGHH